MATTIHTNSAYQCSSVQCVCCGHLLADRVENCPICETPASLSRTVVSRGNGQHFISVLGASNAGKTVYLGLLLDILSKGPESFRGMATSSFSVDLQQQVISALEHRRFPEKTATEADTWKWLHCQLSMAERTKTHHIDLISPDFAGEAIAQEIQQAGLYPAIGHIVSQSIGILVLCDSIRVRDEGSEEDLFAMKLASYIAQQHGCGGVSSKKGKQPAMMGPAIAVVFTKCDGCPEALEDADRFAANNTPRLYEFCRRTFSEHAFFSASVAGSAGVITDEQGYQSSVPFHVQPQGVIEPLQWIVTGKKRT